MVKKKSNKYDVNKTLIKGVEMFVYGGIGALISYLANLPQTQTIIISSMVLKMIHNYLKHNFSQ